MSYELKPRNVEEGFCMSEILPERYKKKLFLHRVVMCNEYELLKPGETINGERWRQQFTILSRAIVEEHP